MVMNKKIKHTYGGMTKDIGKSKFPNTSYFDAKALTITATDNQSTYTVANEKGTKVSFTFPSVSITKDALNYAGKSIPYKTKELTIGSYNRVDLVGSINVKDGLVLFTTGDTDSIWLHTYSTNTITLLYTRQMGFSQDYQITGVSNYENEKIEKVYWVDGVNQLRHLNIRHSIENGDYEDIIDIPLDSLNMIGKAALNQPIIKDIISGGSHTSSVVQYAYSIYRVNGGQSQTSPLSELSSLNNTAIKGDNVNKPANMSPVVRIENIPDNYTNIRVYRIRYTTLDVTPTVNVIYDQVVPVSKNVEIFDDGSNIAEISLAEFIFLSSDVIIPKHINTKDNYLFYGNYEEKEFTVNLDVRAYSFNSIDPNTAVSRVYSDVESLNNLGNTPVRLITTANFPDDPSDTFDNINLDYDTYCYSLSSYLHNNILLATIGGTGKYFTYEVVPSTSRNQSNRYFKDDEIYRIGIVFYNEYGKSTKPMWIADFKSANYNLAGIYNTLRFTVKPAFYTWLNSQTFGEYDKPVGYKIVMAERNSEDKSIVTSGIASTMMVNTTHIQDKLERLPNGVEIETINDNDKNDINDTAVKLPNFLLRNLKAYKKANSSSAYSDILWGQEHNLSMSRSADIYTEIVSQWDKPGSTWQYNKMIQLFSPDTVFNNNLLLSGGLKARIKGFYKNTFNDSFFQQRKIEGDVVIAENRHGNYYATGGGIAHPGTVSPAVYRRDLYYREYGGTSTYHDEYSKDSRGYYTVVNPTVMTHLNQTTNLDNNYIDVSVDNSSAINITLSNVTNNTLYYKFHAGFIVDMLDNNYGSEIEFVIMVNNTVVQTINAPMPSSVPSLSRMFGILNRTIPANGTSVITLIPRIKPTATGGYTYARGSIKILPGLSITDILEVSTNASFNTGEEIRYEVDQQPVNFLLSSSFQGTRPFSEVYQYRGDVFNIYGTPELVMRGQSVKAYNNDVEYKYANTLQPLFAGSNFPNAASLEDRGVYDRKIISVDSDANNNITLVIEKDNNPYMLEEYWSSKSDSLDDVAPIVELVKSDEDIYLGGLYGGNSYEDKRRTKYVNIGDYNKIERNTVRINSPGDTFVQNFIFLRIVRRDDMVINEGTQHIEEIINVPIETTVDLNNRNDLSNQLWHGKISYSNDEYHQYNKVYSQQNKLSLSIGDDYNTKPITQHSTRINASKVKTNGELIDNWLDLMPNEVLNLDGKFGPLTNLLFLNDELYVTQDKSFAKLSINPRVQVQGDDGISIELGSGSVLQDYQYISTSIGASNKHASIVTPYGIYFYDDINKRIMQYSGQLTPLSETTGNHSFIYNKDLTDINIDKPLKGTGLSLGYDSINSNVLMSFLTSTETFTLTFNEKLGMFTSNNVFGAKHYCGQGDYLYSSQGDYIMHRNNKGEYNSYYGTKRPTQITLIVNPEADLSVVVNNIEFKSEAYLNGVDKPDITLTHIRAYNEYQDSGVVSLSNNRRGNLQRLFREWNAQVPRVAGTRERIRNPWTYLELTFENPGNHSFILHDMNISYSV